MSNKLKKAPYLTLLFFFYFFQVFINFARQQTDEVEFKSNTVRSSRLGLLTLRRLRALKEDTVRFTSVAEMDSTSDDNYEITFSSNVSTHV